MEHRESIESAAKELWLDIAVESLKAARGKNPINSFIAVLRHWESENWDDVSTFYIGYPTPHHQRWMQITTEFQLCYDYLTDTNKPDTAKSIKSDFHELEKIAINADDVLTPLQRKLQNRNIYKKDFTTAALSCRRNVLIAVTRLRYRLERIPQAAQEKEKDSYVEWESFSDDKKIEVVRKIKKLAKFQIPKNDAKVVREVMTEYKIDAKDYRAVYQCRYRIK